MAPPVGYRGKRTADVILASVAAALALPFVLLAAIGIWMTSGGPALFEQRRSGMGDREFKLYKLRTMRTGNVHSGEVLLGSPDVTGLGRILRRLKIDELPQLLNILRGDMSVVGPRPCLPGTAKEAREAGSIRATVRPGLTGLAQLNGNTALTWQERWQWDDAYVTNASFALDVEIIARTALRLLLGRIT